MPSPGSTVQSAVAGARTCRFPGAPAHSSVFFSNTTLTPGTVATYTCERGFELLGPARRVCGTDGQWTPEGIPFCGEYQDESYSGVGNSVKVPAESIKYVK